MNGALIEVLNHNREVQQQARALNTRLGEQRFPAMTRDELANWIGQRLGGAALCVSDVRDPEVLRLPALDHEAVAQVERECPHTINVCGYAVPVTYTESGPYVRVNAQDDTWQLKDLLALLPDDGVKLPDGRLVRVEISVRDCAWQTFAEKDIRALNEMICAEVNKQQWRAWTTRLEIPQPDLAAEVVEIPIVEAVYGKCVVRDVELKAYGTLTVQLGYWGSDTKIVPVWFQTREQAESARAKILEHLPKLREKLLTDRRRDELKAQNENLRRQLVEIERGSMVNALPSDLIEDLHACMRTQTYVTAVHELESWILRAQRIVEDAQKHIRKCEAKEQAERAANAAIMAVMGHAEAAREVRAVTEVLVRAFKSDTAAAIAYLRELISSDKGARRKLDAVRGKIGNRFGQRDQGFRFFQLSNAGEITKWLNGMLAALTGETPSNIPAPSPAAAPGGLDLSALRDKFKK